MENPSSEQDFSKVLGQIAAKAWSDAEFKKRLVADPAAVSREFGMPVPPGIEVRIVEDTATVRHFILPPRPELAELSDEQLDQVAGGATCSGTTDLTSSSICHLANTASSTSTNTSSACACNCACSFSW
jgi:hypothetical protein